MRVYSLQFAALVVSGILIATPVMRAQDAPPEGAMAAQGNGQRAQDGGQRRGGRQGMGAPVQGIVTAVTGSTLTIKTEAGDTYAVSVTDTSRIMENRQAIKLSDIKTGDMVMAMGQVDATAKTVAAMMVNATDAATVAKAKENMGRTYITGKITAIDADNLKLTVMRTDNQSQVVAVDEGTSFQRGTRGVAADVVAAGGLATGGGFGGGRGSGGGRQGGGGQGGAAQGTPPAPESITLADIKVGDTVMATGALKGGTFTAAKMGVGGGAGPSGGRRPGPGGISGAADAPTGPAPQPAGPPPQ